ncbi:dihydrolipoyl dehydrogenase [Pararhizobium mangrovi]|uniref:Dihydrolipoyl dehydrogenase n=1 Tax=Pararhizobium mangrovi TaxID=2590452 RepID=A0A506UGS7_9HYPH|nr:dihydrolipoyl dehydrogenase [Pararhizobium mangrovi]TPW31357.1 dihydrolipoyl dehydrogenase [Pararhizobium mangrovi]
MANAYDVIIIGSGPGGYTTAIRAAQLGFKTAIVEREHLGGICLNWGCIPTKALLRSGEVMDHTRHLEQFGLKLDGTVSPDVDAVVSRSRKISGRLNGGVGYLMGKNKIEIIWGEAKVTKAGEVTVSEPQKTPMEPQPPKPKKTLGPGTYTAKHVIIATGARPRALPGIEPDGDLIWTYFEAMVPKEIPKSVVVMGSGAIGVEFASFYRSMGAEVTVVEIMPTILPVEDKEVSGIARKALEKRGITFHTETKVSKVEKGKKGVSVTIEPKDGKAQTIEADKLISAVGVQGNIEGLGLEELGIKTEKGCVVTDGFGATDVKGVYAIGDVAGPPMLAHKAEHEGVICIEKIAGVEGVHAIDPNRIPGCTYCHPQIASVGMTEAQAKEAGHEVKVGRFDAKANGKAIALGEDNGLVKTIFDTKTGQLLGAHMVGPEVTELIEGYVVAMNLETTEAEIQHTIFPHPTLSEMMKESALDAYGKVINA